MSQRRSTPPESAPAVVQDARRLRWLLVVLCAALALVIAGSSALAIALPDIAADLSVLLGGPPSAAAAPGAEAVGAASRP